MAVPATLSLATSAVALWYDQHINAPTRIDTATSPILRGIHCPGNGPTVPQLRTCHLLQENATKPGLMRMARQKGDALTLLPLPPRCKVAPTRTYFL
jgi:hypothetical protein